MKKSFIFLGILILMIFPLTARRNIMMTGYWPPTSQMIYRFSNDPELNPDGWIGENWEGLGFDVYAFFPAYNRVTRDFEVDYQATWEDFWATVEIVNPIAIISYGAGAGPWEIEYNARNLASWVNDYEYPYQPTPCPPDDTVPAGFVRHSTLPVSEIELAVDEQTPLNAWVDWNGNPGAFLCEYMAYLVMWYQDIHSSLEDEYPCLAAGFTHVSSGVNLANATLAAEVTLRTTITYLNSFVDVSGTVIAGGVSPAGTQIQMTAENGTIYEATADEDGNFAFTLIPSGSYEVFAFLDRYFFYQGEAEIDYQNNILEIVLEEFAQNPPLSWCDESTQLVSSAPGMNILLAALFEQNDLLPYQNCHLRELQFRAPANPEDCEIGIILYEGLPTSGEPMLILLEAEITEFTAGEVSSFWIDDLDILNESIWENGLTFALDISSASGDLGWMDEGPAVNGKGNMIKVSGNWMEAGELLGIDGNWDLGLGFYGTPVSASDEINLTACQQFNNFPNPFNPQTRLNLNAPGALKAELAIYNIKGELVKKAEMQPLGNGRFTWLWTGLNEKGNPVASGIYLAKISSEGISQQCKMLLLK